MLSVTLEGLSLYIYIPGREFSVMCSGRSKTAILGVTKSLGLLGTQISRWFAQRP